MEKIHKIELDKYADNPELQSALKAHLEEVEKYMNSDDIPPIHPEYPKSRLDITDAALSQKIAEHDFVKACADGDLDEVKKIVNRFKKPFVEKIINSTDPCGFTGLDYACLLQYDVLEKYLLSHGAIETEQTIRIREKAERDIKERGSHPVSCLDTVKTK